MAASAAALPAWGQDSTDDSGVAVTAAGLRAASEEIGKGAALDAVRDYDQGWSLVQVSRRLMGRVVPAGNESAVDAVPFREPSGVADGVPDAKLEKGMDRQAAQLGKAGTLAPRERFSGDYGVLVVFLGLMQQGYSPEQIIVDLLLDPDNAVSLLPTPFLRAGEENLVVPTAIVRKKDGKVVPPDPPERPEGEADELDELFESVFGSAKTTTKAVEVPENTNLEYQGYGRLTTFVNTDTPTSCVDDAAQVRAMVTYTGDLVVELNAISAGISGECENPLGWGAVYFGSGPPPSQCAPGDGPKVCTYKVDDIPGAVISFDGVRMVAKISDTASGFSQSHVQFWINRV